MSVARRDAEFARRDTSTTAEPPVEDERAASVRSREEYLDETLVMDFHPMVSAY